MYAITNKSELGTGQTYVFRGVIHLEEFDCIFKSLIAFGLALLFIIGYNDFNVTCYDCLNLFPLLLLPYSRVKVTKG